MNSPLFNSCCQLIFSNQDCDYSIPEFSKGFYPPTPLYKAPAISGSILSAIFFIAICLTLRNIFILVKRRECLDIKQPIIINFLVFGTLLCRFVYVLDGPVQLIFQSWGYSFEAEYSIENFTLICMIINFAYSSHTWLRIILSLHGKWFKMGVALIINFCFLLDAIFIAVMTGFTIIYPFVAFEILSPLLYVGIFVNGILFSIVCYKLGVNLADVCDIDPKQNIRVKLIKVLAIGVALCSLLRVINNIFNYIYPDWQTKLNLDSYCYSNAYWSVFLSSYILLADLLPAVLFLVVFSPTTKQQQKTSDSPSNSISGLIKTGRSWDSSI